MEISNKTLAWLVVAAIAVSIFGTVISLNKLNHNSELTGFAVSNTTGTANVAISSQTVLRFAVSSVDFGSGQINTSGGYYSCNMSVNDSTVGLITKNAGCLQFNNNTPTASTFQLQNAGTTYLNVTLNFSQNASGFIGGSVVPPSFQFAMSNNGTGTSCLSGVTNTSWTEVTANITYNVCQNLSYYQNNTLMIGIKVSVPADAIGSKSVTILAQGTG